MPVVARSRQRRAATPLRAAFSPSRLAELPMHTTPSSRTSAGQSPSSLSELSARLAPELKSYITRHRNAVEHDVGTAGRGEGERASTKLSKLIDGLLCSLFHAAKAASPAVEGGVALGAVGSYGRRSLSLYSDIDVHLVTQREEGHVRQLAESLLYPLWDAGVNLGHQIVVPAQAVRLAASDLPTATALLDFRLVAGDAALAEELRARAQRGPFSSRELPRFLEQLTQSTFERHERFGDSVFLLEPDVKNGAGGVRDLDVILWAGAARWGAHSFSDLAHCGALNGSEAELLHVASGFLLGVRNRLHLYSRRRADRLVFDQQERLAECLGYGTGGAGVEEFMSDYYRYAQATERTLRAVLERARPATCPKARPVLLRPGVELRGEQAGLVEPAQLGEKPELALQVYEVAVERGLEVASETRRAISGVCVQPEFCSALRDSREAAKAFVSLVCSSTKTRLLGGSVLRELHDVGLLLAMVPEFSPVVGRVHHDIYHVYTVDAHSLAAVDRLREFVRGTVASELPLPCRLAAEMPRPQVVFCAALLHDIGKDEGGRNHSERGAEMCRAVLLRLGLEREEIDAVADLTLKHLRMYHVATRRDIDDPQTLAAFCAEVGSLAGLNELFLLTVVDVSTTSPTAFTPWKRRMLQELYVAAERWFDGCERVPDAERFRALKDAAEGYLANAGGSQGLCSSVLESLPQRYFYANRPPGIARHLQLIDRAGSRRTHIEVLDQSHAYVEVGAVADDRPGLLSLIAAALAHSKVRVVSAQIYSFSPPGGGARALDLFWLRAGNEAQTVLRALPRVARVFDQLVAGELDPLRVVRGDGESKRWSERPAPPVENHIQVDNETASRHTVVEVIAQDRRDLLFWLSTALYREAVQVSLAKLHTEAERVADVFYVNSAEGAKLDAKKIDGVTLQLRQILTMLAAED